MNRYDYTSALRDRLSALRDRLRRDVREVQDLSAVAAREPRIEGLLADLDRQLVRMHQAAVITLVGPTGAGKSTLLNALAGDRIATEGVDRPTTRRPVIYAPEDADLSELMSGAVARPEGYESEGGVEVVRHRASGPWASQILVDAPDLNSVDVQHRAVVTALAERSDVLVIVLHRQAVVEAASVSFVDDFAGRRGLVFVLNRADELAPAARDALVAQIRVLAAERWQAPDATVVALSAKNAQSQPGAEGWTAFCDALLAQVRDSAITGVRRLNALGTAGRVGALFGEIRDLVSRDLGALPEEAEAGLGEVERRAGVEVATRLTLRQPDLTEMLCAESARRWDGPGGWALRAGSSASLGLGAGAALVRRHPMVAAGAAVAGVALEQLRDIWRDERVAETGALVPGVAEFEGWYTDALSAARVRAARLAGSAEQLGLPSPGRWHSLAVSAVEEAWHALVDRDLPAAAARSALRFLRFFIDLPVYALIAWVVYQVASGFVAGRYAGIDFLVNAALLLVVYLIPVRWLVKAGLRLRARRLLDDVTAAARRSLAAQTSKATREVHDQCAARAAVLDRLSRLDAAWREGLE